MTFGAKLILLRKQKSLSQGDVAEAVGVSRDAISKYERDEITPSVENAKKIAYVLGVSIDFLVNEEAKEEVLDNEAVKRIKDIQKLPQEEKTKIFSVIDALVRDYKTRKAYAK